MLRGPARRRQEPSGALSVKPTAHPRPFTIRTRLIASPFEGSTEGSSGVSEASSAPEPADLANKSVVKAVRLLHELGRQPSTGATASTLAKAAGMSRPTAFRMLASLEQTGMVDRLHNRYVLGWELARLGRLATPFAGLGNRVEPLLKKLADEFDESVTFSAVGTGGRLDLVAAASAPRVIGVHQDVERQIGQTYPLHASSSGKVFLADLSTKQADALLPAELESFTASTITDRAALFRELSHVREQGYAVIDDELEEGLLAVSCPVRDSGGVLVAILNLNAARYRFGRDRIVAAVGRMQHAAVEISHVLWPYEADEDTV